VQPEVVSDANEFVVSCCGRLTHARSLSRDSRDLAFGEALKLGPVFDEMCQQRLRAGAVGVGGNSSEDLREKLEVVQLVEVRGRLVGGAVESGVGTNFRDVARPNLGIERLEGPASRSAEVLGRQPARLAVLDVREMHRTEGVIDAEPGEKGDPPLAMVGTECLLLVLVDVDLIVSRCIGSLLLLLLHGLTQMLIMFEERNEQRRTGKEWHLGRLLTGADDRVGNDLDRRVRDPVLAKVHAVCRLPRQLP